MMITPIPDTSANAIRWDLSELFLGPEDPKISVILTEISTQAQAFSDRYKSKIYTLSVTELKQAYQDLEALLTPFYKVSQYGHLVYATDTANDIVKRLVARTEQVGSDVSNLIVFFRLEIGQLSQARVDEALKTPIFSDYAYSLSQARKNAKYNLAENVEQVISIKDLSGVKAWCKLYEELTSSFQFSFEIDGKIKTMNGSELRALRQHHDPEVRGRAMRCFYQRYEENSLTITQIFNSVLKDHGLEGKLRGYTSPIASMNTHNDLPDEAVEALHAVTTESYALVQRYYKLKASLLHLPDLTLADIYAPLPQSNRQFTYDQAKQLVLDGFNAFDEEFYGFARDMFDKNRIDAPVTPTKRGGAFCSSSTPDLEPYVLLNFLGRPRDVMTMAHELGHAIHDRFCSIQPLTNYHPILPLAETASVFSEMIVTDLLLKQEQDPVAKQALLTDKLEDIFATSHRQNMFSSFEQTAHKASEKGLISTSEFCDMYEIELKKMFGDSVRYTPEYRWEWSSIPHLVEVPFYVYAYNFGNLLVMALYQHYREEGPSFIPKLKTMLRMGSSKSPLEITAKVGINIQDPAFWRKSFALIEDMLVQLETLVTENK